MLYAIKVILELHWGYSIKRPIFSASQPVLLVPPPSSLLGALARALAYFNGMSENTLIGGELYSSASLLIRDIPWITLALSDKRFISPILGLIESRDIIRALIAPYQRSQHIYPGSRVLFGIQPHGRIYAPSMRLNLIYLAKDKNLGKYAWCITSLGNKESVVSVLDVHVTEIKLNIDDDEIETFYYFPSSLGEVIEGRFLKETLSKPSLEHYKLGAAKDLAENCEEFTIPLTKVRVKLYGNAKAITAGGETIVIPQQVIKDE
jgi:CRISPR-associated protein Cas5a/b/c